MELILSRKMQEHRIFPAIDIAKSGTRREDLLLNPDELDAVRIIRHSLNSLRNEEATDTLISLFKRTKNNQELVNKILTKKAL